MCESIYTGNTQKTFKKQMDGHFFNLLHLLKNRQKPDFFAAHFEQHFNSTVSHRDLRNLMVLKVANKIKPIGLIKIFTKPN